MKTLKHITLGFVIGVLLMIGANSMDKVIFIGMMPKLEAMDIGEVQ